MRTDSGFTLIELMIILAIIAILSASAIPSIKRWVPEYRLKSAMGDLQSNMQKARVKAVKENTSTQIRFDRTNSPGFYYFDNNKNATYDAGEFKIDLAIYGSGVDFGTGNATAKWDGTAFAADATIISFGTRGLSSQNSVYLQNNEGNICYAIPPVLQVRPR